MQYLYQLFHHQCINYQHKQDQTHRPNRSGNQPFQQHPTQILSNLHHQDPIHQHLIPKHHRMTNIATMSQLQLLNHFRQLFYLLLQNLEPLNFLVEVELQAHAIGHLLTKEELKNSYENVNQLQQLDQQHPCQRRLVLNH